MRHRNIFSQSHWTGTLFRFEGQTVLALFRQKRVLLLYVLCIESVKIVIIITMIVVVVALSLGWQRRCTRRYEAVSTHVPANCCYPSHTLVVNASFIFQLSYLSGILTVAGVPRSAGDIVWTIRRGPNMIGQGSWRFFSFFFKYCFVAQCRSLESLTIWISIDFPFSGRRDAFCFLVYFVSCSILRLPRIFSASSTYHTLFFLGSEQHVQIR